MQPVPLLLCFRWVAAMKLPLRGFSPLKACKKLSRSAAFSQKAALQMPLAFTTPPVKMRLERSAELVGTKPLHLLTQTALPLKSPTGAFIAALRSANAVAPNAKFKVILPLLMRRATRSAFQIVRSLYNEN